MQYAVAEAMLHAQPRKRRVSIKDLYVQFNLKNQSICRAARHAKNNERLTKI